MPLIHHVVTGLGSPPIVFVHGFGCGHQDWDAQVAHFSPRHQTVAVDLRGHGASPGSPADCSIERYGADVAELMHFDHDTAGGLMTTEFVVFPKKYSVGETIRSLREMAETPNMIYYLYVVEEEGSWKLSGLISLRSLILADPTFTLEDVMRSEFRYAHPSDSAADVAQTISEYNLLALPVVDDEGDIAGIVTVDDAMEILLPKNFQRRLPRLFG